LVSRFIEAIIELVMITRSPRPKNKARVSNPIYSEWADEVTNPKKVGHLFGDETNLPVIKALGGGSRENANFLPYQACESREGENFFVSGKGKTLEGLKPQRGSALMAE
jgi:hypothetical protein